MYVPKCHVLSCVGRLFPFAQPESLKVSRVDAAACDRKPPTAIAVGGKELKVILF